MSYHMGLGGIIEDAEARATNIAKGAEQLLALGETAADITGKASDVGDVLVKIFSFGADDIDVPAIGYNAKLSPVQRNSVNAKELLAGVALGYVYEDEAWVFFGLLPPKGKGAAGQVWNGATGRWEGAGKPPRDTTTPIPTTPALELAQKDLNWSTSAYAQAEWSKELTWVGQQIAAGNYTAAVNSAVPHGLTSIIRTLTHPSTRLAIAMGMRVERGPQTGVLAGQINALRISQVAQLINAIPLGQRPANAAAIAVQADPSDLPATPGGPSAGAGGQGDAGGGGGALMMGAALLLALRFMR